MAKYLMEVSYSSEGAKGLLKDGGTKRKQVVENWNRFILRLGRMTLI